MSRGLGFEFGNTFPSADWYGMSALPQKAADSVFRVRDFNLMFAAAVASKAGSEVVFVALPLVAVVTLQASPLEVGLLGAATMAAFLLVSLPAGAWLDRVRRQPVMIIADFVRAVLYASIPVAWWLDSLTIGHLYLVAVFAGIGTVFFDVAAQSYLPTIINAAQLMDGNARLSTVDAASRIIGRGAGGSLSSALTAPGAVLVTAAGYICSALCIIGIRSREAAVASTHLNRQLRTEIREGLHYVLSEKSLRAIAAGGAISNLFSSIAVSMLPILLVRQLGLSGAQVGIFLALSGVGALAGAGIARSCADRLGYGRALWMIPLAVAPFYFLIPNAHRGWLLWLAGGAYFLQSMRMMIDNIIMTTYRQHVTPMALLGRVNASLRFLMWGTIAIGAAASGFLADLLGVRGALLVSASGQAMAWLPVYLSPLRNARELPDGDDSNHVANDYDRHPSTSR